MDSKQAVAALGALAQDSRLQVFRILVEQGPDGLLRASSPSGWAFRRRR
ncbi:hypothetical protein [Dankookia sp. P2]